MIIFKELTIEMSKSHIPLDYSEIDVYSCHICGEYVLVFEYEYGKYEHHDYGPCRLEPKREKYKHLYSGESLPPFCDYCHKPICPECTVYYGIEDFYVGIRDKYISVCKSCSSQYYRRKHQLIQPDRNTHEIRCECCGHINVAESDSDIEYPDGGEYYDNAETKCSICNHTYHHKPERPLTKEDDRKLKNIAFTCPLCDRSICEYHIFDNDEPEFPRSSAYTCDFCGEEICRETCTIWLHDKRKYSPRDGHDIKPTLPERTYILCRQCVNDELIPHKRDTLHVLFEESSTSSSVEESNDETIDDLYEEEEEY